MNEMFKRMTAILDSQATAKRQTWAPDWMAGWLASASVAQAGAKSGPAEPSVEDDFRDTDVGIAWLCEASNKTRSAHKGQPHQLPQAREYL